MLRTISKQMNNETIGMTGEFVLCLLFNISNNIEKHRWDTNIANKMITSNMLDILLNETITPMEHVGGNNGPTDFMVLDSNNETKTLSLKTLKKAMEKFAHKVVNQLIQVLIKKFVNRNNIESH